MWAEHDGLRYIDSIFILKSTLIPKSFKMSCSVIIKDVWRNCERRVYVDSEEELKNMTVKEFRRRFCPPDDDEGRRYIKLYILKEPEDRQCRPLPYLIYKEMEDDQTRVTEFLDYDQTLGYYGIREGSTIHETEMHLVGSAGGIFRPSSPEDKDKGVPRTRSMDTFADMQKPQPKFSEKCCLL